ncbi:MAG: TIGR03862 family flavoprotein [Gammaproteobacteria bacterium]|nr:TIGR03862 family flavoprotein [Gammaproteobacteria bacterium]
MAVVIIGGGPAGLMAAEVISRHGVQVDVYDAMPSVGRKFLMAGKSGLNLTHAEPLATFVTRYGEQRHEIEAMLHRFGPTDLRAWAQGLGVDTYVGSSGRVFPVEMKAAPLLRAWLHRLRGAGVRFHMRHQWLGLAAVNHLRFMTPTGEAVIAADATVLALGGGSWARLGSTGAWVSILAALLEPLHAQQAQQDVAILPLRPSNCGFELAWSEHLRSHFAGEPVKSVRLMFTDATGAVQHKQGDFVVSQYGIEGSLIYAFAAAIRDVIERNGSATIAIDLLPDMAEEDVAARLAQPRGKRSLSAHLRRQLKLSGVKAALLYEVLHASVDGQGSTEPQQLAALIKALPLRCERPRPIDEAISTAGGVSFTALDEHLMLKALPSVFCAGEMLDWDAPTGGYLLTACFASGYVAGQGVVKYLGNDHP